MTTATPDIASILDQDEARMVTARDESLALARRKPTRTNLAALKKAETALEKFRSARYEELGEQSFDSLTSVADYLASEGWKIGISTIYEHKDAAKIRPDSRGKFPLSLVLDYARQHLQRKDGSASEDKGSLQERKLLEEIRRISSDASFRELKYKEFNRELISKEHVEVELASRAADLKTHLDASARSAATRIIKMVTGDIQKAPELISFMLGINRKVLDNYSRPIQGPDEEEE
jgi:hypothetical protein